MCAKVKHAIFSKKKLDFRGGGGNFPAQILNLILQGEKQ